MFFSALYRSTAATIRRKAGLGPTLRLSCEQTVQFPRALQLPLGTGKHAERTGGTGWPIQFSLPIAAAFCSFFIKWTCEPNHVLSTEDISVRPRPWSHSKAQSTLEVALKGPLQFATGMSVQTKHTTSYPRGNISPQHGNSDGWRGSHGVTLQEALCFPWCLFGMDGSPVSLPSGQEDRCCHLNGTP